MSEENIEVVGRFYEDILRGDHDAALRCLVPDVVSRSLRKAPSMGERPLARCGSVGKTTGRKSRFGFRRIRDLGESVLVLGHLDLTARTNGITLHEEVGQLGTFRDGKIATVHDYPATVKPSKPPGCGSRARDF